MINGAWARMEKYSYKYVYSLTVLQRYMRAKKLVVVDNSQIDAMWLLIGKKRRGAWHSFDKAIQNCWINPKYSALIMGRKMSLSQERLNMVQSLFAVDKKLTKLP